MLAYLDCFSGISGDMFLASLIGAGLPVSYLKATISKLGIKDLDINITRDKRHGISGIRIEIDFKSQRQQSRSFSSIKNFLLNSKLESDIKNKSLDIFNIIATAEAEVHNCKKEDIHFHEIGGLDSIIDIVGTVSGMIYFDIEYLVVSTLPLGKGNIKTSHGIIPIPSPATLNILKGIPTYGTEIEAELVTPTGAALVRYFANAFGEIPPMIIKNIGYGIGTRDLSEKPNIARLILGEPYKNKNLDTVVLIETNIDDYNPEYLGYIMDMLFQNGALDVAFVPIYMKKNRPGICIKIICNPIDTENLMNILFKETSTLGIRYNFLLRKRLKREIIYIDTPWGKIKAKKIYQIDGSAYIKPEYEECLKIAKKYDIPIRHVYEYIAKDNV